MQIAQTVAATVVPSGLHWQMNSLNSNAAVCDINDMQIAPSSGLQVKDLNNFLCDNY